MSVTEAVGPMWILFPDALEGWPQGGRRSACLCRLPSAPCLCRTVWMVQGARVWCGVHLLFGTWAVFWLGGLAPLHL